LKAQRGLFEIRGEPQNDGALPSQDQRSTRLSRLPKKRPEEGTGDISGIWSEGRGEERKFFGVVDDVTREAQRHKEKLDMRRLRAKALCMGEGLWRGNESTLSPERKNGGQVQLSERRSKDEEFNSLLDG